MGTMKKLSCIAIAVLVIISFIALFPWITTWAFYFYTQYGSCNQELITAVRNEDVSAIKTSLANGTNPDCTDMRDFKDAKTPLSIASQKNNAEIVNILIEGGADPKKTLMGHYGAGATSATEILVKRAKLSEEELNAMLVSYSKSPGMMRALLESGANINSRISPNGWQRKDTTTPLYQASYNTGQEQYSHPEGVKFLLDNGANPNLPGFEGNFPLGAAAINRNPEIIESLIKAGADVNRESKCGFPPLIIAAAHGFSGNVNILLEAGAALHTKDNRSRTNESCANDRLMGQKRLARLDQVTADHRRQVLGIQDARNKAEAYQSQNSPEMAAYVVNRSIDGPYDGTALMWAAYSCDAETVSLLLEKGAEIHARDAYGATALMWGYACDSKAYERVVPLLLKAGADPSSTDSGGKTAKEYLPDSR